MKGMKIRLFLMPMLSLVSIANGKLKIYDITEVGAMLSQVIMGRAGAAYAY